MQSIDLICYFYPKIYDLNNIFCDDYESPKLISCDKENLEKGGIYLIDNGFYLILYLAKNLDNQNPYFDLLFKNIPYRAIINEDTVLESEFNDDAGKLLVQRLKNIIESIRTYKILFQTLTFVVEDCLKQNM